MTVSETAQTLSTDKPSFSIILKKASDFINESVNSIGRKYTKLKNAHPKLFNIIKKVLLFAAAVFLLYTNPLATALGLAVGAIFAKEIKPLMNKVSDTFKNSNWMIKALMITTGIGLALFAPSLTGIGVGLKVGTDARLMLQNRV